MTEQLYYIDSYKDEFSATVKECKQNGERFYTVLDKTAFFPEGGGQSGDRGEIDGVSVLDTVEIDGKIFHITEKAFEIGKSVIGKVDFKTRFSNMQNHSGEHIVSGLACRLFNCNNVGFHLSDDDVTIDYDVPLNAEQIELLEQKANETVFKNIPIVCSFPSSETLEKTDYRSKKELLGKIRLVEIPGIDICACCAPHVNFTGEIGIIKLLDAKNYKGGVRIHMLCGQRALEDYKTRYKQDYKISSLLSANQYELAPAVEGKLQEIENLKKQKVFLENSILENLAKNFEPTDKNAVVFTQLSPDAIRNFVTLAGDKCKGVLLALTGNDNEGYRYCAFYKGDDFKEKIAFINSRLNGRGGGKPPLASGTLNSKAEEIKAVLEVLE